MYDVKEYGAAGDGATDDSGAFQAAIDAIAKAGKGTLFVPAGEYRIETRVARSVSGWNLVVAGEGVGVSRIVSSSRDGIFSFEYGDPQSQLTFRDLSLFADAPDVGPAFDVRQLRRGNAHHRNLTVQSVEIRGLDPAKDFFRHGVKLVGVWRPFFLNAHFAGPFGPGVRQDYSDGSGMFRASAGFEARDCYAPSFQHCYSWGAASSFRVVSEKDPGPEDGAFYRCFAVESRIGIEIVTGGHEPQLVIDACHINCRDVGVFLRNRNIFTL